MVIVVVWLEGVVVDNLDLDLKSKHLIDESWLTGDGRHWLGRKVDVFMVFWWVVVSSRCFYCLPPLFWVHIRHRPLLLHFGCFCIWVLESGWSSSRVFSFFDMIFVCTTVHPVKCLIDLCSEFWWTDYFCFEIKSKCFESSLLCDNYIGFLWWTGDKEVIEAD